jgi:hypothetical protein
MDKGEVVLYQSEVPLSLTIIKVASLCLVLKIAVICRNGEGFWQAHKVVTSVFQPSHNSKQLAVIDLVVAFRFG